MMHYKGFQIFSNLISSFDVFPIGDGNALVGIATQEFMFFYFIGESYSKPSEFKFKAPEGLKFTKKHNNNLLLVLPNFKKERKVLLMFDIEEKVYF